MNNISNEAHTFSEDLIIIYKKEISALKENFKNLLEEIRTLRLSLEKAEVSPKKYKNVRGFTSLQRITVKGRNRLFSSKTSLDFLKNLPKSLNDLKACYSILNDRIQKQKPEELSQNTYKKEPSGELLYNAYGMCTLFDSILTDIQDYICIIDKECKSAIL